ncbi:phage tail protein [Pseudomonas aeruginosa]|uniref:phage tail protein n=1 Tax=Pseudomonas aeruginosa TaxID=287 RepID=UPI0026EFAC10|nr:phage tail protein [Pseudomonas aeruginosa]
MAWYSSGTVTVTANSPTVTGAGTQFSSNARVGDAFRGPDGRWYEVTNVASSTVISIKPNYQGSTASGQSYAVAPILGYDKDLSDRFNLIANQWGETLAGIKPWATSATPGAAREALGAAPLASPALTGNPTAPTPAAADSDSSIATTAHVKVAMGLFGIGTTSTQVVADQNDKDLPSGIHTAVPPTTSNIYRIGQFITSGRAGNARISQLMIAEDNYGSLSTRTYNAGRPEADRWMPWVDYFHNRNILGTVSQSGGVPTGAIIERGSNANGEYVRFADGTQICTNSNRAITADPAAFIGAVTSVDGNKLRIGRWF